jgi:8-oxo-dGTP pyrophosphatase MutT (NUDIX family)
MEPEELLAAFDATGRRLTAKPRSAIHRDRDWHWLVFVWAARRDAHHRLRLLLQVRGRPGDPHLGSLDAPAGGHVAAAETHLQAAYREFAEEAGVALGEGELFYLGERRLENPDGICRRAFEHLYLCRRSLDLRDLRFSPETSGFVEVDLGEFADLLQGRGPAIPGLARWAAEPEQVQRMDVDRTWLASYAEPILDGFRWSLQAIRTHFGQVHTP